MSDLHKALVQQQVQLHVSTTGAGLRMQTQLWDVPGASQYLVGFFTPYARSQLQGFLGHPPEASYCAPEVALDLAMASYLRAGEHAVMEGVSPNPIGVGVTASVASERLPRGEHRAHVALITKSCIHCFNVELERGVGAAARVAHDVFLRDRVLKELQAVVLAKTASSAACEELALERFYRYPVFDTNGRRYPAQPQNAGVYLPATLNPIHDGHRLMCRAAEARMHWAPGPIRFARYLVSSSSPHKGRMSVQEMLVKAGMLRAERWRDESRVVEFTRDEPLFLDKARKRPGSVFLIGADTMRRMLDPAWGLDVTDMLTEMRNLDVHFWVMERNVEGEVLGCRDVAVPWPYQALFQPLEGRLDVSSAELRAAKQA